MTLPALQLRNFKMKITPATVRGNIVTPIWPELSPRDRTRLESAAAD